MQDAHANSLEHFPSLAATINWAHCAHLETEDNNRAALIYTVVGILNPVWSIFVSNPRLALVGEEFDRLRRSFARNWSIVGGKAINAKEL